VRQHLGGFAVFSAFPAGAAAAAPNLSGAITMRTSVELEVETRGFKGPCNFDEHCQHYMTEWGGVRRLWRKERRAAPSSARPPATVRLAAGTVEPRIPKSSRVIYVEGPRGSESPSRKSGQRWLRHR